MVPAACLTRKWQRILAPPVLHFEEAFRNIDVRLAILAHRAQFYQMCVRDNLTHGPQQIQVGSDVVDLCPYGMLLV